MQGSFQVAQATGTGNSTNSAPVRIYKLTKPLTDQAVVINLGYDQKAKVDFSSIANEKITLVHVGEKLIILFDNQSTVTVEPFFDSRADSQGQSQDGSARNNITIEMAPGRDVSVQEFAGLFPISTDTSVLPAADNGGNSNANAQASGADFRPFAVDPLGPVPTNQLAPQEELPGFNIQLPTGFVPTQTTPAPTISGGLLPELVVDESFLTAATNGVAGSGLGPAGATVASVQVSFNINAPGGQQSLTYALSISAPNVDTGLIDSATGQHVLLTVNAAGVVEGRTAAGGDLVFTVAVDGAGHVTLTDLRAVHEATPGDFNEGISLAPGLITLNATVTDNVGQTASASVDVGPHLTIHDDGPAIDVVKSADTGVVLTTHDALTVGVASDADVSTANFGGVFSIGSSSYGADGAGSTALSYTLGVASTGVDSTLDSHGASIFLYNIGGVITGSTALTAGAVGASNTIFTLSVNGSGVVTLTQYQQIDHVNNNDTSAPYDDQFAVLGSGLVTLTGSATITDFDGDKATSSQTIDLGGNVQFADDGPAITVAATGEAGITLTTHDALTIGPQSDVATSTANFGGVFTIASSSYGADGAGSTTALSYTLSVTTQNELSGLKSQGEDITLAKVGNDIIGSTASHGAIFAISVDANGVVTLTQYQQIDHVNNNDTSAPYDDQFAVLANNLVTLTGSATITDFDGDKATSSQTIDLGGNVQFADDGPAITVAATGEAGITLITHDALTIGPQSDVATSTANFGGVFTIASSSYGADGAGSTTALSYTLAVTAQNELSGLKSQGEDITLAKVGNDIIGSTASHGAIFAISVDANGVVTLTQYQQIDHVNNNDTSAPYDDQFAVLANNLVTLTGSATITDFDGDKATSSQTIDLGGNVQFADDGPAITVAATGEAGITLITHDALTIGPQSDVATSTANFGGVFTIASSSYGADGAGSTTALSYTLAVTAQNELSGLKSQGEDITLAKVGNDIIGSTASHGAIFAISVDANGVVTLTQYQQIDHVNNNDTSAPYDDQFAVLANNLVTLTGSATITDFDGDKATSSQTIDLGGNVQFADDGPAITVAATGEAGITLTTHDALTIGPQSDVATSTANFGGVFTIASSSYGADGAGSTTALSYTLSVTTQNELSGLKSQGEDITLAKVGNDIIGSTASHGAIFAISVDANGVVTLTQYQQIDHVNNNDTSAPYDDQFAVLANNLVTLTGSATITDFDGDKATSSQTIDLGGNVQFADDGPAITVAATGEAGITLITHDALTIGPQSDVATSTANFGGVFTIASSSYGADGAGSTTALSYTLSVTAQNELSGLKSQGEDITLAKVGNDIIGSTASHGAIFAISVDANGVVTLTQYQQIDHVNNNDTSAPYDDQFAVLANNLVTLTGSATITDFDGDKATSSQTIDLGGNVQFADDGPAITVAATGEAGITLITHDALTIGPQSDVATSTANFGGVFTIASSSYGADGAGSTTALSYTLAVTAQNELSGLKSQGEDITLAKVGNDIIGSTASHGAIFAISVDANGVVTLTQYQQIDHVNNNDTSAPYDDQFAVLANNLVTLTGSATITDFDGDKATSSQTIDLGGNVQFADDGPAITVAATGEAGITLITHDALTIGPQSDVATSTANFGGVFTIASSSYGADGAGSTTALSYTLAVTTQNELSGLKSQGEDITLAKVGNDIIGSTASHGAIFAISVDANGVVTLTQYQQIDHVNNNDTSAPYDDQFAVLGSGLVTLTGSATITDFDGDKATSSQTIDLGGNVQFADDGPAITVAATGEAGITLTTHDALTIGPQSDVATSTANFGGVFTIASSSYGADGAGSTTALSYTLSVTTQNELSGLKSQGEDITLAKVGNDIIGSTASHGAIFAISVDANGVVTLTQYQQIDHVNNNDTSAPYDDQFAVLGTGLVTLTGSATITDFDGDKATSSQTIDLGGNVQFADDGPAITVAATGEAGITLTTHDALTIGPQSDVATSTANFGGVFTIASSSYGADGAGSTTALSYTLAVTAQNELSGLKSQGEDITLAKVGNDIIGSTASHGAIFAISVDANGVVTLTQYQQIDHVNNNDTSAPYDDQFAVLGTGLVTLTGSATITDFDGDKATSSQTIDLGGNVQFADDGPAITVAATGEAGITLITHDALTIGPQSDVATSTANFGGVFTIASSSYGADGAGSTTALSYTLAVTTQNELSGLKSQGEDITLAKVGNDIIGSTASHGAIFAISVDANGVVTLTQYQQIDHVNNNDTSAPYDDQFAVLGSGLVTLTGSATITDFDGDKATSSQTIDLGGNVQFADDGPAITVAATGEAGITLITHDALTIGPQSDVATSTANFGGVFTIASSSYGADGAGSTTALSYTLAVTAQNELSGLKSQGEDITLAKVGNDIIGSTASHGAIFAISVDANGVVTLTQYQQIDHVNNNDTSAPYDDQFAVLGSGLVTLTGSATITDFDGDKATSSQTIDLGGNVQFADDGPAITVAATGEAGITLITHDALTIGPQSDVATSTANFGGVFTIASSSYGADGAGSTTALSYTLAVTAQNELSGLKSQGEDITLAKVGNDIIGSTASHGAIFAISVDANGVVTLTQYQQIDHVNNNDTSAPYDDQFAVLGTGLVTLTGSATITDFDGDKATSSQTIDLGGNVQFADDGPAITVAATGEAGITLITHDALTIGPQSDVATSTANFGGVFTIASSSYGADGAGSTTALSYTLAVTAQNELSGLKSQGEDITLAKVGNDIIGSTASHGAIFAISVDANGVVTLTQYQQIDHVNNNDTSAPYDDQFAVLANNLVTLTGSATITDFDGDKATSSQTIDLGGNVQFADDGPAITVAATGEAGITLITHDALTIGPQSDVATSTANFGGVFTIASSSYGADGAGSTTALSYTLSVTTQNELSGLKSQGEDITLAKVGNDIIGSTASHGAIFAISVDANGVVTLTQYQQIDHVNNNDTSAPYDDQFAVLANNLVTLTGSATITDFDGDKATSSQTIDLGGNVQFADDGPAITVDDLSVYRTAGVTIGDYHFDVGADSATFSQSFPPQSLVWTNMSSDYTFTLKAGTTATYDAQFVENGVTKTYFEITINNDGTYSFNLVDPMPSTSVDSGELLSGVTGGSKLPSYTFDPNLFDGAFALTLTATDGGSAATLTISSTELGINGNTIQQGEVLKLDVQQQPGYESSSLESITLGIAATGSIAVNDKLNITIHYTTGLDTVYQETYNGSGSLVIDGFDQNRTVDYFTVQTANNFNFKVDGVSVEYTTTVNPADNDLQFALTGKDGDGDSATASFDVNVLAGTAGNDTITTGSADDHVSGGPGNDTINAGPGNDIIIGGPGDDTLSGGTGADKFVLASTAAANGHDTITDLDASDSIIVDVANLNLTINTATLASFTTVTDANQAASWNGSTNQFLFNTTHNELWYSANGTAAAAVDLAHISTGVPAANAVHVM
ncbi:hypothetical protein J2R76_002560 [Bradyrhizobium sp. USDA 4532]|uniref:DUF5801 repeats-in-toxin domain-containing protein n=2 Tax=Bradyrhizobium TaxID=374 RepID=UPI00209DBCA9|nr:MULTISPECIES: DUF5801 repeats-in-toxin domain-containing protein [unclassified Bradyrhizobium]MCP1834223.1 hypothetical protein [Bradyrhizobium sp. USDA 4545]MCP1918969.1 hypothetical protein [Bradyrhizobium sp. USDA 4532]